MSEEIKIYFDEDGIAKEYDDTYDITIHCESEEEQNELLDRLNRQWIPVSERLPEKYTFVWATCKSLIDDRENWVIDTCYLPKEYNSEYSDWGNIPMLNWGHAEVIAWMEQNIPKPYKRR